MCGLRKSWALWGGCFADAQQKLEASKLTTLISDPSVWRDEEIVFSAAKCIEDLLASGPEVSVAKYFEGPEKHVAIEFNDPSCCGDAQISLGREVARAEKRFTIKLNEELL